LNRIVLSPYSVRQHNGRIRPRTAKAMRPVKIAAKIAASLLAACLGIAAAQAEDGDATGAASAAPAAAKEGESAKPAERCFSRQEQRTKTVAHKVVPLSKALRAAKGRRSELLGARLCERGGKLVYLLTLLGRDGKVVRATVDASNGALVGGL
jgi:uncharacterized membrane protein YkoI